MTWAKGLKRITLLMAIVAAIVGGICIGMIPVQKYCHAQNQFGVSDPFVVQKPSEQEVKEFEEWVQEMAAKGTIIDENYYVIENDEALSLKQSLPSLKEIRPLLLKNRNVIFWRNLSKPKLVGICILAGLAGASAAFFSVWFVFWFGGLAVYRVIRWVVLGFCDEELKS
jgi:hypothetical protein